MSLALGTVLALAACSTEDVRPAAGPSSPGTPTASSAPTPSPPVAPTASSAPTPSGSAYPSDLLNATERLVLQRLARDGGNPQLNELGGIHNADVRMTLGEESKVFVRVVAIGTPGESLGTKNFGSVTAELRRTHAFGDLYSFKCNLTPLGPKTVEVAFTAKPDTAVPAVYALLQCGQSG
jgi:hypothetical protein